MTSSVILLAGMLSISGQADTIRVEHSDSHDLTGDAIEEEIRVSARGKNWDALLVRLEIRSNSDSLLFADEWSSEGWCGGGGFYQAGADADVQLLEQWVRTELQNLVDPEHYLPTGEYGSMNGSILQNRREVGYGAKSYLYEQLWREKYDIPIHEHLCQRHWEKVGEIYNEFRGQVSDERVESITDEVIGDVGYMYGPHFDALYIVAWIPGEKQFAIVIHP